MTPQERQEEFDRWLAARETEKLARLGEDNPQQWCPRAYKWSEERSGQRLGKWDPAEGETLTVKRVREGVAWVKRMAKVDSEMAHCREGLLHVRALELIAEGRCEDTAACAQEALKTLKLKFGREYSY